MKLITIGLIVIIINVSQYVKSDGMIPVFEWKQIDFYNRGSDVVKISNPTDNKPVRGSGNIVFPDQYRRNRRIRSPANMKDPKNIITSRDQPINTANRWNSGDNNNNSLYIAYNNVPMGATMANGRLFVTVPRRRTGIPSTLNYIDMKKDGNNKSPKLIAYPDIETNSVNPNFEADSNHIISVYRTTVDECKRLWFIDTGMLEYPGNRIQVQRPSIWVMDLNTDRLIRRFEIPTNIVDTGRGLASITIDVDSKRCGEEAYAYIPDLVNSQLYVYSFSDNRIWAFSHNYFNFDPLAGDLQIGGQEFRWDDGIFSITLGPQQSNGHRNVYFHAMASNNEFLVSNEVLQNESNAARSDHGHDFQLLGNRGNNHQSTMHEYDPRTGVIFYSEINRNGIGCWNTNKAFSTENQGTVQQDAERMIYPSDLSIDESGTIWVMTNSMPIFIYASLDPNIVNFRIWKQDVHTAIKNTVCK